MQNNVGSSENTSQILTEIQSVEVEVEEFDYCAGGHHPHRGFAKITSCITCGCTLVKGSDGFFHEVDEEVEAEVEEEEDVEEEEEIDYCAGGHHPHRGFAQTTGCITCGCTLVKGSDGLFHEVDEEVEAEVEVEEFDYCAGGHHPHRGDMPGDETVCIVCNCKLLLTDTLEFVEIDD